MNALINLQTAADSRDADALRTALSAMEHDESSVPLLSKLLMKDWHDAHEDIVFELGLIGDSRATEAVAKAVRIPFDQLVRWNNLQEFQRKCAYALARIGSPESRAALEDLASDADPHLREYGQEGLQKWPLQYRRDL